MSQHNLGRQPFRGSIAIASGLLTSAELRSGRWCRLFHDVYVRADVRITDRLLAQAALLRLPDGAVVVGRTAAQLWGADLADPGQPVEVLADRRLEARGIQVRTGSIATDEVVTRYGVPIPTLLHTTWDLGRSLPRIEAIGWVDRLANRWRLSTADLVAHAETHLGEWRAAATLDIVRACDGRAESPPESTIRVSLHDAGVPAPVPQWEVATAGGLFIARVDFAWPELMLALEYDGQWHADRNQLARDRERIRRLNAVGWYVYPVTRNDLRDIDRLVENVRALIRRRSRELSGNCATKGA